jgi:hypothetical protein
MQAVRALSSMRRVSQRVLRRSRSVKAAASLVKRCGESKRLFSWSVVGASRPRAAPRSQLLLGVVQQARSHQRAGPLAAVPSSATRPLMRRRNPFEFCRRWGMLHRMASSSSKVALALMRCVAGVKSPVAHIASVPQPNPSVKRTPDGAAYLQR